MSRPRSNRPETPLLDQKAQDDFQQQQEVKNTIAAEKAAPGYSLEADLRKRAEAFNRYQNSGLRGQGSESNSPKPDPTDVVYNTSKRPK